MKIWYQIITYIKNWYLIVTDVIDKTVKNWNGMQKAFRLDGILSMSGIRKYATEIDFVGNFHNVGYCYEIYDILISFLHALWWICANSSQYVIY